MKNRVLVVSKVNKNFSLKLFSESHFWTILSKTELKEFVDKLKESYPGLEVINN